ncbi:MAG: d(CMP) kinase [Alphaproteobacteria bacterium]|nr:d(CMP) kinase [Alphaproteobacteria bacterium]
MAVIAVDGPAASGKGTLAVRLAEAFGLPHLDTGLLYRAVGYHCQPDLRDAEAVALRFDPAWLANPALRGDDAAAMASKVGAVPAVRTALLRFQQAFAAQADGAVLDGRDIGTVIAPHATAKLFIDADVEVRAARRRSDLLRRGQQVSYEQVLADLIDRDARDRARTSAPLRPAPDAFVLDTTHLDITQVFAIGRAYVAARLGRADWAP